MSSETSDNLTGTSVEATIVEQGRKAGLMKNELRKKRLHKAWKKQKERRDRQRKAKQLRDDAANIRSDEPTIDLNVGGIHYLTSLSTLTSSPDSYFGVMFSGRHDLKAMQCKDGSYFIDRDGTHFRHILNFLRDGEEVVESFPKSNNVKLELIREAKFYLLDGLTSVLKNFLRKDDVVDQDIISFLFEYGGGYNYSDCGSSSFSVSYHSWDKIVFKYKSMRGVSFSEVKFAHAVSFIDCDLTNASFQYCCFESDAIFEDCILHNTKFHCIKGLVTNSCKVSFTGSKTDKTNFDSDLRSSLQSSGKIP